MTWAIQNPILAIVAIALVIFVLWLRYMNRKH